MKSLFNLYKEGLQKPRIFMASFDLKRRQVLLISWLAILVMSLSLTIQSLPIFDAMMENIHSASQYIPEYTVDEGILKVPNDQKPVYYQSEFFQLVFDPSITSKGSVESLKLPQSKQQQIKSNIPMNVFIFQNQAFVLFGGMLQEVKDLHNGSISTEQLKLLFDSSKNFKPLFIVIMLLVSIICTAIFYVISTLMMAMMAGIYNKRLSRPVPFKLRYRAMVVLSLLPIVVFEIINTIIPSTIGMSYIWVFGLTLWQYFRMIRDQTFYIMSTTPDLEAYFQQLKESQQKEAQQETQQKKDKQEDVNDEK